MSISYKRKKFPWQVLDEKTLVLSSVTGEVHQLNPTGTWIWKQLEQPKNIENLVEDFLHEVEASYDIVLKDFEQYMEVLIEKKLVDINE
jgi:methyltransferase-like protein